MNRKKRIEINSTILLTTIALMLSQRKNANKAYSERVVKLIMYDLQEWGKWMEAWKRKIAVIAVSTITHIDMLPLFFLKYIKKKSNGRKSE